MARIEESIIFRFGFAMQILNNTDNDRTMKKFGLRFVNQNMEFVNQNTEFVNQNLGICEPKPQICEPKLYGKPFLQHHLKFPEWRL